MAKSQGVRRERAGDTRRRILKAAQVEFVERGFHGATIASIAKRAGVAAQTVYFVFHTKANLISAAIDALVMGEDDPVIPQDTLWWAAMRSDPDAAASLRHMIRGAAPIFARASVLGEILRSAAITDDEVRTTHEHHERLRRDGFREVVEVISTKSALRKPLTVDLATDILMTMYSDTTYYLMVHEHRWSDERYIDWLCDVLPIVLFESPKPRPSPRAGSV